MTERHETTVKSQPPSWDHACMPRTVDTSPRRNLWIVNHYAGPPRRGGGTRHHDLARQLHLRGHAVTIFASSVSHFGGSG